MNYDILVFSHLRWHSVTQRPHHIMRLLSNRYRILFIEEPEAPGVNEPAGSFSMENINEKLSVLTPRIEWNSWPEMGKEYAKLLKKEFTDLDTVIVWIYSPFFVHILNEIRPATVVYDCMDELSAFRNASPNLPRYEKELLKKADVVFTGGKSLFEAKQHQHDNVHCFPSSVDRDHFEQANSPATVIPDDLLVIPKPVVGFYGVIDERLNYDLLKKIADAMPDVNFVMIGPLAKVEQDEIAHGPNIHYLGKKDYSALPQYAKGFDVAMMPFALNESTQFISPTKTLEFIAAGKPIVSTPIHDVARDYQDVVKIAANTGEFVQHIRYYLQEPMHERMERLEQQRKIMNATSWEMTVSRMREIIERVIKRAKADLSA